MGQIKNIKLHIVTDIKCHLTTRTQTPTPRTLHNKRERTRHRRCAQVHPHLRPRPTPRRLPEDPGPIGPRTREEVRRETRAHRGPTAYPPQTHAEDEEPEADATAEPHTHGGPRLDPGGSRVSVGDRGEEDPREVGHESLDEGHPREGPTDERRTQTRHIRLRVQEADREGHNLWVRGVGCGAWCLLKSCMCDDL